VGSKRKSVKFAAMTINEAGQHLLLQLQQVYERREAANITELVMENLTGLKKIDRVIDKENVLNNELVDRLNKYSTALAGHQPVQYVLHEAWFSAMKFYVDESVLIPRPETEELVQWVIENYIDRHINIVDIGTGSGCIPVTLKKFLPGAEIFSCDISNDALTVAKKNALSHNVEISFLLTDILDRTAWYKIPLTDIIVSNPPYIPLQEKRMMNKNVVGYEPHQALFVDDSDPLIFYRAIAELGRDKLSPSGNIFVEIHEEYAKQTASIFKAAGYTSIEIKKDMQGKERMIRAALLNS